MTMSLFHIERIILAQHNIEGKKGERKKVVLTDHNKIFELLKRLNALCGI